jgi:hypothetical protein
MPNITARFSIWSEHIEPERISKLLNVMPDSIVLRGINRIPSAVSPKLNGWHLSVAQENEREIEGTLKALLFTKSVDVLKIENIRKVDKDLRLQISISITFDGPFIPISYYLHEEILSLMARLKVDFDIDHFFN